MLEFFRKYQTYFFGVITVVIVISFSFFGTYNMLPANSIHEQVAFTAVDGTEITRHELDEVVAFLSTDSDDKLLFGGIWGPNFLNDGVIRKDILETGIGNILAASYPTLIEQDLAPRLEKEKRYTLYSHPDAKFVGVEGAWSHVAPEMKGNFDALRRSNDPTSEKAFAARTSLFLTEKQIPAPLLRQILSYQQRQYTFLTPDPTLERIDLSLFGYHTLEDWFGPRFMRVVAQFIINSSKIAAQKGYIVSKEEALADLRRNAEVSYRQNLQNPHLGVANGTEYFEEQLRRLGMDQTKAVRIWQEVLLFRRLFQDVGNAVLIDELSHQQFFAYAKETVLGDLYRLPSELRLKDYRSMQKLEIYLDAASKHAKNEIALPTNFLTVAEVKKKTPALIQKRYTLEVAQIKKSALQSKVSLKEMWNWEVEDKNWASLKKEFPDLGIKKGDNRAERLAALDSLDDQTRNRVDLFARNAIVEAHPEWITATLAQAEPQKTEFGIRLQGGKKQFDLENRQELIQLLDQAALMSETAPSASAKSATEKLAHFNGDGTTYYRITVLERAPQEQILTFAEANREGVLDQLLDKELESYYTRIRDTESELFQREDKSWKPFADVKNQVADLYFEKLLSAISADYKKAQPDQKQTLTSDRIASLRLYSYIRGIQTKLNQGKEDPLTLVRKGQLNGKGELTDQFKLEQIAYQADRSSNTEELDISEMFALGTNGWTKVYAPVNGDLYFLQLKEKAPSGDVSALYSQLHKAHAILSDEAQRHYAYAVVDDLKVKQAISLDYLERSNVMEPEITGQEPVEG